MISRGDDLETEVVSPRWAYRLRLPYTALEPLGETLLRPLAL